MNWVNYAEVLGELRAHGLLVREDDYPAIGRRVRCRSEGGGTEKRGWYHLHEIPTRDGQGALIVGSYGIWHGQDQGTVKISVKGGSMTPEQRQALKDRIREDTKRAQARRREEGERAARRAAAMWQRLAVAGESEYLARKGVNAYGVRFSPQGTMVIPLLDVSGVVHGLQLIYPKGHQRTKRLGRDKDFFPPGLVKQAHFFLIGNPAGAAVILLAEGYATGATLHEATGRPVVVAFDAGNLLHVAKAVAGRYRQAKLLICADDDYLAKCRACGKLTSSAEPVCSHCGAEHQGGNAGTIGAGAAAMAVDGAWLAPFFEVDRPQDAKGPTDFNDLHLAEGLHVVRAQVEGHLAALNWGQAAPAAPPPPPGEGEPPADRGDLYVITHVQQLTDRFSLVYEMTETVFDADEHKLVPISSMRNLCSSRQLHRQWMESLDKRIVRVGEVGFDPSESDPTVKCNLWGGWPTRPKAGDCSKLLELGEYLCSDDVRGAELWAWMLKWLAYPVQHPGAKMKTAMVLHGPQGTGKNVFFEAYMRVYGEYGKVIDQKALEDKFNDTFSRKLFLVADEVVARQELYHSKNDLKHLITGTEIRINPKNVGAYFERNCLNLVFLSNEPQPMVLERDDRRYCIIWTPPKLEKDFYRAIKDEIAAGGIEALHDYLLHLDLGDFDEATEPPMSQAKADLIELSLDSSERFYNEWLRAELPLPIAPARTEDLYAAYRHWCGLQGIVKPAQLNTIVHALSKRPGTRKSRERHFKNHSHTVDTQSTVFWPAGAERDLAKLELSTQLVNFSDAVNGWRNPKDGDGRGHGHSGGSRPSKAPGRPAPAPEDEEEPF